VNNEISSISRLARSIFSVKASYFVLFAILTAISNRAGASVDAVSEDPLFSADYNPRLVHFDLMSTKELLPACKKVLSDISPLPPALALFGKSATASSSIYIAGTGDNVKILVLRDNRCDAGIPILALLQRHHNPPDPFDAPALSDAEVTEVFSDALTRYSKAFGGKGRFFEWLDALTDQVLSQCKGPENLCAPTYRSFTPLLQNLLQNYRKAE